MRSVLVSKKKALFLAGHRVDFCLNEVSAVWTFFHGFLAIRTNFVFWFNFESIAIAHGAVVFG
jgi:hypothetical protein